MHLEQEMKRKHKEMQKHFESIAEEKKEKDSLMIKLKAMESKLLQGDENIVDKQERQQKIIQHKEEEMRRQREAEDDKRRKIAEMEEERIMAEENYSSVQDEIAVKSKKLKKLFTKFQGVKAEINDMEAEFQREREGMLDTIRELTKTLKLKSLVIDVFVPPEEVERIVERAEWNQETEDFNIMHIEYAGNNVRRAREEEEAKAKEREDEDGATQHAMEKNGSGFHDGDLLAHSSAQIQSFFITYY